MRGGCAARTACDFAAEIMLFFDRCRDACSLSDRRLFFDAGRAQTSIPKAL
jgi:hypothetical protein